MQILLLALATLFSVLFLLMVLRGKRYAEYADSLEGSSYPLHGLYTVGFAWSETKLFALRGKLSETLIAQAKLLYSPKFAEDYARLTWAQTLTFVHLSVMCGCVLSGLLQTPLFAVFGLLAGIALGYNFLNAMKSELNKREEAGTAELPEIVSSMALLINSGMILKEAWSTVAYSREGEIYTLMQNACVDMDNGLSEADALYKFGMLSNSSEVKKFTSSLVQSLDKGNRDLCNYLVNQSGEMWNLKKQYMLQKGEAAASKLLAPIAMIFIGVLIIVMAAAIGMLM